jgi:lipopolysaccharide/colanic/teichoic acid biosynthesis glycosyltransferase
MTRATVEPNARFQGVAYGVTKRAIDIAGALVALVILAIPSAVIAALIWIEDRQAAPLMRQRRCGRNGSSFELYKFRTMVHNAEELKEQLRAQSVVPWPDFRVINDPRVTRVGRILRKTSLDELPQFLNVLRGDMALVGPRPTTFAASTYELWETGRLDFRPGLTGPWQVYGRNSMDFDERCRLEIGFFRRRSIARELALLVATVPCLLRRTGVS